MCRCDCKDDIPTKNRITVDDIELVDLDFNGKKIQLPVSEKLRHMYLLGMPF